MNETNNTKYWILFLQPLPETGERIAVALVFYDGINRIVEYDTTFSRILKLYPDLDINTLKFYLQSLQKDLESSKDDIHVIINSYGPQISPSNTKKILHPISKEIIRMLLKKHVNP